MNDDRFSSREEPRSLSTLERAAFDKGREARRNDLHLTDNPYKVVRIDQRGIEWLKREAWKSGWIDEDMVIISEVDEA